MNKIISRMASSFSEIKSQIAFYPTILTFCGFAFALFMKKTDGELHGKDGTTYLKLADISFSDLMYYTMAPLRTYCCGDPVIVQRLALMLRYLSKQQPADIRFLEVVKREWISLMDQANFTIKSEVDLDRINNIRF